MDEEALKAKREQLQRDRVAQLDKLHKSLSQEPRDFAALRNDLQIFKRAAEIYNTLEEVRHECRRN